MGIILLKTLTILILTQANFYDILMRLMKKIGIIGFGNMGSACGFALKQSEKYKIYIYDKAQNRLPEKSQFIITKTAAHLIEQADIVFLAIKPQEIKSFLKETKDYFLKHKPLLITIAAGVPTKFFEKSLKNIRIIRAMPNLAAKVHRAISFICKGKFATNEDLKIAEDIFSFVGEVIECPEGDLDKVTAVSGSGPGYIYYFLDCLYSAACSLGFNKNTARKMVSQTFLGAADLAREQEDDFRTLVQKVVSKGGTTEAGLKLWKKNNFKQLITKGIKAAYKRAKRFNE